MEFAIKIESEEQPLWVMAVDTVGERFLIAREGKFEWMAMADCAFAGAAPPDKPRPVIAMNPAGGQKTPAASLLTLPGPMRPPRRGNHE